MKRRRIIKSTFALAGVAFLPKFLTARNRSNERENDGAITIKKLSWAGILIETKDKALFIDVSEMANRRAELALPFCEITSDKSWRFAAITHTHLDHFDKAAIKKAITDDGFVVCHEDFAAMVASNGLIVESVKNYEPFSVGELEADDITVCAIPALDGYGVTQVSWIVSAGGKRIIHCGDTMWHGHWRQIGRLYGPFDAAFLPINAAVQPKDIDPVTDIPFSMSPVQAVEAARLLKAKLAIPIHFGRKPTSTYVEVTNPLETFIQEARKRKLNFEVVEPGKYITWTAQ